MAQDPLRIAILVSGEGTTMQAIAEAVSTGTIAGRVVLVASDRPGARALERASRLGLPTLVVAPPPVGPSEWESTLAAHLAASGAELIVLAGYLRILRGPVMERFAGRIINLHPSLLPRFGGPGMYGLRVQKAILESGDTTTGSTVHLVTPDVDRGPTIAQRSFPILPGEAPEQLAERQRPLEHELMVSVIRDFASGKLPLPWRTGPVTYASSGVDTGRVRKGIGALNKAVTYHPPTSRGTLITGSGAFAGVIRYRNLLLALTTDGVGTKVLLAEELERWREVAEDMVAVNVNDLSAIGAVPIGLVDHIMCREPEDRVLREIGRGLNDGLKKSRTHLLGGETAVVPSLLASRYDLSATALGVFAPRTAPLTGDRLRAGDVLIGLSSSGFHANGYTLVRRLLSDHRIPLDTRIPGERLTIGSALLRPTHIYAPCVEPLLEAGFPVAMAHITGGGFRKNLLRLSSDLQFTLDGMPEPSGLFAWVKERSGLPAEELYRTFNMGIGFIVAVRERHAKATLARLSQCSTIRARVIGHMERGSGVSIPALGVFYPSY